MYLEDNRLSALPQRHLAELTQVIHAGGQREEMDARELAHLRSEMHAAVGKQDVGLAYPPTGVVCTITAPLSGLQAHDLGLLG